MIEFIAYVGHELKNMLKKPATAEYPGKDRGYPERYRGHVENDISRCILCGMCMRGCPSGAISVSRPDYTWQIHPFSCVQCNNCVEVCPVKCLSMKPGYTEPGTEKSSIVHRYSEEQIAKEIAKQKALAEKAAAAKAAAAAQAAAAKAEAEKAAASESGSGEAG